ncbi:MAG: DUF2141 domain-containing protein [Parvularculaceae bacterium]
MNLQFNIALAVFSSALLGAGPAASKDTVDDSAATAAKFEFDHVSCKGAPNEIRIVVNHIKKSVGLITADLYRNDDESFLHKAGRQVRVRFAARAPLTRFCMTAPEAGEYAIAIYHDKNANKKLDKGAFGIPSEPWGLSRNPRIRLRKPRVEEALIKVAPEGSKVEISLNN